MSGVGSGATRAQLLLGVALTFFVVFVLLGALVASGDLTHSVDTYALQHLMPGISTRQSPLGFLDRIGFGLGVGGPHRAIHLAAKAITLPAWGPASVVVAAILCGVAYRRRRRLAFVWAIALGAITACELASKAVVERPALFLLVTPGNREHISGFDSSYPSGHEARGLMLAFLAGILWPRLRPVLAAWLVAGTVMLEVGGYHTPSDLIGGGALGAAACIICFVVARPRAVMPAPVRHHEAVRC